MTLIATCTTHEYIVQVSDRRLTWPNGSVADDTANKAVAFLYDTVFAYTGIAQMGDEKTDQWLAGILKANFSLEDAIQTIKEKATERVKSLPYANKRLAIIGACWASEKEIGPHMPIIVLISNFHDNKGVILNTTQKTFSRVNITLKPSKPFGYYFTGQLLPSQDLKKLGRNIKRAIEKSPFKSKKVDALTMRKFTVEAVREVARKNYHVGKNIMLTIIPNRQIPEHSNKPTSFYYFPEDKTDPVSYSPILVSRKAIFSHIKLRNLKEGEFDKIKEQIKKGKKNGFVSKD